MEKVRILKSPWKSEFVRLVKGASRTIQLASPFVKKEAASLVVDNAGPQVRIDYLNAFKLSSFHRGASDLEALRVLYERKARLRSHHQLHAKVFIFDGRTSVVTSGNLTPGGLANNYEYGLLIKDENLTARIARDYRNIFSDKELTRTITKGVLDRAAHILDSVPKEKRRRFTLREKGLFKKVPEEDLRADLYEGGTESIMKNLKGWEKDTFNVLNEIDLDVFRLADVYKFEARLQKLHPRNRFVKDKIRQKLQVLRDLGLVQFLGGGVYRKMWV